MKNGKLLISLPLILGILSVCAFGVYYYSANHSPYNFTWVIVTGPVFALAGVILSIVTAKSRKNGFSLWLSGLIICSICLALCIFILILMFLMATAMANGQWS